MAKATLKLPKLAVSMQEGKLTEWFAHPGDYVRIGQTIYVIETEKTAQEIESPFAGRFTPLVEAGTTWAVGTPIAEIDLG
jgi:pyruvate/2-oxoglutarate dehydrogenase complex dihydrolipoamide acyltransferase (E2) component